MKNVFHFTLKAVFVLKIFKFLCWLFGHVEKQLYLRHKIILKFLKFLTSQPGKQTIAILILPNILERKGHQIMKFGQLIEYNISNIFLENHTENSVEKLFPDPFLKNQKCSLSLDREAKVLCILFLLYAKLSTVQTYGNWPVDHLFLPHMKLF